MEHTTIRVDEEVADELARRKGRGDAYNDVIRDLLGMGEGDGGVSAAAGHGERTAGVLKEGTPAERQRREKGHARVDAARERVHKLDLPGSGERQQCREAGVLDLYQHLMNHAGEVVTTQELKAEIDADEVDYASVGSFWTNCVKSSGDRPNALVALPGVEELGGGRYHYDEPEVYSE